MENNIERNDMELERILENASVRDLYHVVPQLLSNGISRQQLLEAAYKRSPILHDAVRSILDFPEQP